MLFYSLAIERVVFAHTHLVVGGSRIHARLLRLLVETRVDPNLVVRVDAVVRVVRQNTTLLVERHFWLLNTCSTPVPTDKEWSG